jgi:hypothetical protein
MDLTRGRATISTERVSALAIAHGLLFRARKDFGKPDISPHNRANERDTYDRDNCYNPAVLPAMSKVDLCVQHFHMCVHIQLKVVVWFMSLYRVERFMTSERMEMSRMGPIVQRSAAWLTGSPLWVVFCSFLCVCSSVPLP